MLRRLIKYSLIVGGISAFVCVCLYLWALPWIIEQAMNEVLKEHEGKVRVTDVELRNEWKLCIDIESYQHSTVVVRDTEVIVPVTWLVNQDLAADIAIHSKSVEVLHETKQTSSTDTSVQSYINQLTEQLRQIEQFYAGDSLPLSELTIHVTVDSLCIRVKGAEYVSSLELEHSHLVDGSAILTVALRAATAELHARMQRSTDAPALAIDFTASANNWNTFTATYIPQYSELFAKQGISFEMATAERFVDMSGYLRWSPEQNTPLNAAVLGNLEPARITSDSIEVSVGPSAFGVATNGSDLLRTYVNMPITRAALGAWETESGELSIQLENDSVDTDFRSKAGVVTFSSDTLSELPEGKGAFSITLSEFSLEHAVDALPEFNLELTGDVSGQLRFLIEDQRLYLIDQAPGGLATPELVDHITIQDAIARMQTASQSVEE